MCHKIRLFNFHFKILIRNRIALLIKSFNSCGLEENILEPENVLIKAV